MQDKPDTKKDDAAKKEGSDKKDDAKKEEGKKEEGKKEEGKKEEGKKEEGKKEEGKKEGADAKKDDAKKDDAKKDDAKKDDAKKDDAKKEDGEDGEKDPPEKPPKIVNAEMATVSNPRVEKTKDGVAVVADVTQTNMRISAPDDPKYEMIHHMADALRKHVPQSVISKNYGPSQIVAKDAATVRAEETKRLIEEKKE